MDDLISRQAAIDAFEDTTFTKNEILRRLLELPSAQPSLYEKLNEAHNEGYDVGYWAGRRDYEQKWIPVTERLPEDNTTVLVTHNSGRVSISSWHASTVRTMGFDNPGVLFNTETGRIRTDGVKAWMPLPEPYKEEKTMNDIKALIEELEIQHEAWGKQYTFAMIIRDIEKFAAGGDADAESEDR